MSKYDNQLDEVDDLLDELDSTKNFGGVMPSIEPQHMFKPSEPASVTDDNINQYILDNTSSLITQGRDTLERLGVAVNAGADVETIDAYTRMFKAVSSSIDVLNKVNIQNKKAKNSMDLKSLNPSDSKPQIGVATQNITNNITTVVATREEMMEILIGDATTIEENKTKNKKTITK